MRAGASLVETDTGFVLKPDRACRESLDFAKALLNFLRQCGTPVAIGGSVESDILTIQPLSARRHDDLKGCWIAWQARARPGAQ